MSDQYEVPVEVDEEEAAAVGSNILPEGFVPVYDSPNFETGEIICATLCAAGLRAVMQNPTLGPGSNLLPFLGNTWSHAVYVAPEDAQAAREILSAQQPTEEELAAEQEADPTTLEEAEADVRNA